MPKTRNSPSGTGISPPTGAILDSVAMPPPAAPSTSRGLPAKGSRRACSAKISDSDAMPPPPIPPVKRSAVKSKPNSASVRLTRNQCTRRVCEPVNSQVKPRTSGVASKTVHFLTNPHIAAASEIIPPQVSSKRASADMPSIAPGTKRGSAVLIPQPRSEISTVISSSESSLTSKSTSKTTTPISSAAHAATQSTISGAPAKPPPAIPSTSRGISNASRLQRNAAEKQRRDKVNGYINQLANLVPMVAMSSKRLDKTSILRLSAAHLRLHKSPVMKSKKFKSSFKWCPNFLNPDQIREILESVDGFLIIAAPNGKILFTSRSVERYLGYQDIDMIGHSLYMFIHPFDVDALKKEIERLHKEAFESDDSGQAPRVSFRCRMKEKGQPRSEVTTFQHVRLSGDVTVFDEDELPENSSKSSSVITHIFKIFVRTVGPDPYSELFYEDASDEYLTRHSLDGTIIFADQRISLITGYLTNEVTGHSAYNYILSEDIPVALFAHHLMFSNNNGTGMVVYRLRTKEDKFIYLKSVGCLQYKANTTVVDHFVCINQCQSEADGKAQLKCFADRYIPQIKNEPAVALFEALRTLQVSGLEQSQYLDILNVVKKKSQLSSLQISTLFQPNPPKNEENILPPVPSQSTSSHVKPENVYAGKIPTNSQLSRLIQPSSKMSAHLDISYNTPVTIQNKHSSIIADNLQKCNVQKVLIPSTVNLLDSNNFPHLDNSTHLSNIATQQIQESIDQVSDIKTDLDDFIIAKYQMALQNNKSLGIEGSYFSDEVKNGESSVNIYNMNAATNYKGNDSLILNGEQIFALNQPKHAITNLDSNFTSIPNHEQFFNASSDLLVSEQQLFNYSPLKEVQTIDTYSSDQWLTASSSSLQNLPNEFYSAPKMLGSIVLDPNLLNVENQGTSIISEMCSGSNFSLGNFSNVEPPFSGNEMKANEVLVCEDISLIDPSLPLLDDSPFAACNLDSLLGTDDFIDSYEANVSLCPDLLLEAVGAPEQISNTETANDISSIFRQR